MMEDIDLSDDPSLPKQKCLDAQMSVDYGPPDPQIQIELERLNTCTDLINKLEVDLDEGRMIFRQMLSESTQTIDSLSKKLGKCIDQARPYYDCRIKAKQSMNECQKSAVRFERAVSQHTAAREMVQLAEEGLLTRGCIFDSTWQEMLNHATTKVNDAEKEKIESANEHREKSTAFHDAELQVKMLQKDLRRAISKSRPYFEMKAAINQRLEEQKKHIKELEEAVTLAKSGYAQALINLENISDHIHKERETKGMIGIRGVGVGAESSLPRESAIETPNQLINSPFSENSNEGATYTDNKTNWVTEANSNRKSLEGSAESIAVNRSAAGWQFIPPRDVSTANSLTVDDRESIMSDTESLTSIEMLSEEAISNLMLDSEIQKVSESLDRLPDRNLPLTSSIKSGSSMEIIGVKDCLSNSNGSSHHCSQTEEKSEWTPTFCQSDTAPASSSQPISQKYSLPCNYSDVNVGVKSPDTLSPQEQLVRSVSLTLNHCYVGNTEASTKSPSGQACDELEISRKNCTSSQSISSEASNCSELSSTGDTFQGYIPLQQSAEY